ncbi:MAG: hypothetical protein WB440_00295 [Steroidobacteraceae bacterium]|jgi:hypothetical protein
MIEIGAMEGIDVGHQIHHPVPLHHPPARRDRYVVAAASLEALPQRGCVPDLSSRW